MELTHIGLFSGIGGDALAARWAGFKTLALCEKDDYCRLILRRNWPDAIIWEDIENVSRKELAQVRRLAGGIRERLRPITVISGGYPCQGESLAGQRGGEGDDRWLWPEMLRIIRALRPAWVIGENVAGHITMGLAGVLSDLEGAGYQAVSLVIPACAIGAPHRRDRVFIVANSEKQSVRGRLQPPESGGKRIRRPAHGGKPAGAMADPECHAGPPVGVAEGMGRVKQPAAEASPDSPGGRLQGWLRLFGSQAGAYAPAEAFNNWKAEPAVGRVVDGLSSRVDKHIHRRRLEALGNSIVPQQVYPIFQAIALIEGGDYAGH